VSTAVTGPFLACCALLVLSGVAKLRDPRATRHAAAAIGVASAVPVVLGFGAVELLAGGAGAMWGGWAAFAVAVMYLALAAAATRLLRRAPNTPCACLGSTSAPVTRGHIVVDLAAAFVALCAAGNAGSPLRLVGEHPEASLVLAALVGCCVALFGMVLGARSTEGDGVA
jgi:Methylamine utilisation protein MauE